LGLIWVEKWVKIGVFGKKCLAKSGLLASQLSGLPFNNFLQQNLARSSKR
jgi:hypothetical protein